MGELHTTIAVLDAGEIAGIELLALEGDDSASPGPAARIGPGGLR